MSRYIVHDGHTQTLSELNASYLKRDAVYIFSALSDEARLRVDVWAEMLKTDPLGCVEVVEQKESAVRCRINGVETTFSLTDVTALRQLCSRLILYVDMTGLTHSVWAALLRAALDHADSIFFIYTEPGSYKEHESPSSSSLFDLTTSFGGVAPLPGMANLSGPDRHVKSVLVPFLGFESARPKHIAFDFDPQPMITPIVGLPGFKADYPQITIATNNEFLDETRAYRHVRYARASCPFDAYSALSEIHRDNPGSYLYIAPTGTKPHALGAVWYALDHPRDTEIIYDHPVRRVKRTSGVGLTHIYCLKPRDAYI
jgi:hypothetical protein